MIRTDVTAVLDTYYDVLRGSAASFDPERLRAILADDLAFEGPIAGSRIGAEGFVRGLTGFVVALRRMDMLQRVIDECAAATLYDAELVGGVVRFAEFFRFDQGKIAAITLHYDASLYRARGGG